MGLLTKYYRIGRATGVSIHLSSDGAMGVRTCTVITNGNQLDIQQKVVHLDNIAQLKQHLPSQSMIALNLSGKIVLQKQVEMIAAVEQSNFNKVLPNSNVEDFYVQNFISGETSFISLIRRTEADRLISQINEAGFKVMMLSLGPFPIETIIPQLNIYENDLIIDGNTIKRNERGEWLSVNYNESALSPFPIKIASEKLDEKLIVPYACAFQLVLAAQLDLVCAQVPYLDETRQKRLADNRLKVWGFIVLVGLFILLLANYITLSWLNTSNAQLNEKVSASNLSSNSVQELGEQVKKDEALLKNLGWEGGINKSGLIDQVAALLPGEVKTTEISINPVDLNASRSQKILVFYQRRITIVGTSEKIIPVNEWIARIKTRPWVKTVRMESYTYDTELNTGKFLVTIDY